MVAEETAVDAAAVAEAGDVTEYYLKLFALQKTNHVVPREACFP